MIEHLEKKWIGTVKQGETQEISASFSTWLSVFAVSEALKESTPCRQSAICHLGSSPPLITAAKMLPSHRYSKELHSKLSDMFNM